MPSMVLQSKHCNQHNCIYLECKRCCQGTATSQQDTDLDPQWSRGLHHDRDQSDVTINLQVFDVIDVNVAVYKVVGLHPVGQNPEGALLTTNGQLQGKDHI